MTTVNEFNGDKYVLVKGAPEIILERCNRLKKMENSMRYSIENKIGTTRKY